MLVFIFISETDPRVRAFTCNGSGSNLPVEYFPWQPINGGRTMHIGSANDPIAIAIREDGYCLVNTVTRGVLEI
jgi:hypothetical protein